MAKFRAVNKRPRRSPDDESNDNNDTATGDSSSELSDIVDVLVDPEERPPDARTANLRRPITTNKFDFWYFSQKNWNEQMAKTASRDKATLKNALQTLRRYSNAGRLMETDDGVQALIPCYWCARPGSKVTCKLIADGSMLRCAYCIGMGKSECTARLDSKPRTFEERLEQRLEERIAGVEQRLVEFSAAESHVEDGRLPDVEWEQKLEQRLDERIAGVERRLAGYHAAELYAMHGRLIDTDAQLGAALAKVEAFEKAQQTWIAKIDELVQTVFGDVVARWRHISQG